MFARGDQKGIARAVAISNKYEPSDGDGLNFAERSAAARRAYYIIDQLNALDVQDPSKDRNDNEKKAEVHNSLMR